MKHFTIITGLAGLIGAFAWIPWLFEWYTKPKLEVRIISSLDNEGTYANKPCLLYFRALSIVSLHKTFNIKDVEIKVTYRNTADTYSGNMFWGRTEISRWKGTDGKTYKCLVNPEDSLPYIGSLPKNQTKTVYLFFKVDKAEYEVISELKLRFIEQSGYVQDVIIKSKDINSIQIVWDDRIWECQE